MQGVLMKQAWDQYWWHAEVRIVSKALKTAHAFQPTQGGANWLAHGKRNDTVTFQGVIHPRQLNLEI